MKKMLFLLTLLPSVISAQIEAFEAMQRGAYVQSYQDSAFSFFNYAGSQGVKFRGEHAGEISGFDSVRFSPNIYLGGRYEVLSAANIGGETYVMLNDAYIVSASLVDSVDYAIFFNRTSPGHLRFIEQTALYTQNFTADIKGNARAITDAGAVRSIIGDSLTSQNLKNKMNSIYTAECGQTWTGPAAVYRDKSTGRIYLADNTDNEKSANGISLQSPDEVGIPVQVFLPGTLLDLGIDMSAYNPGAPIYLKPSSAGELTTTEPTGGKKQRVAVWLSDTDFYVTLDAPQVVTPKVYRALITDTGSLTVTILENTLGTVTWDIASAGEIEGATSGLLTPNKTAIRIDAFSSGGLNSISHYNDDYTVYVSTYSSGTLTGGILNKTYVEILVYP